MNSEAQRPKVYLVGGGPGDPGLLTLRAVECLREADFILYDYLTSPRTLAFARPDAETLCVDQIPGDHPQRWPQIHQRIIDEARKGKIVVHLKGGDPLIFGRGGEEAESLREAGVPYEIVPGVTAAFAAGAYAEIPLTHRAHASALAIVTGHEHPGKPNSRLDWDALAKFPGTLAIYMGVARLGVIAQELIARGKPPETPAACVHQASTGTQRTVTGMLQDLESLVTAAGITTPALMLVGPVVALKPEMSWYEALPLKGLRVLVTRPREQAQAFARRLELLGAVPEVMPVIELGPPGDWSLVDRAIDQLESDEFDWVIFTSANSVRAFLNRVRAVGKDVRVMGGSKIAAIGPATRMALAERHLIADLVPEDGLNSESLLACLADRCQGQRLLLPRAAQGREKLKDGLAALADVEAVTVYEQHAVIGSPDILDRVRNGDLDVVTLTSPNIADAFLATCDQAILERFRTGSTLILVNSRRLGESLVERGIPCQVSAGPTEEDLIRSLRSVMEHVRP
jgi:uroporphyrinogen III methyltransferase/synthase